MVLRPNFFYKIDEKQEMIKIFLKYKKAIIENFIQIIKLMQKKYR